MRFIDGTPVDKIEQRFNVFATEINSINEKTQTDRKAIVEIQQQATNLARSLSESIEKFNKDIAQTETSLSQNIQQKTSSLNESIKLVADNLTNTQKELTALIQNLNKGTTEATPEQLGARLALLEEWQTKIDQWKKLLIDEDTDNVINTLTEILAFFKDVPEDVGTILDLLNKKVDKSTRINGIPLDKDVTIKEILSSGDIPAPMGGNVGFQKGLSLGQVYNNGYPTSYGNLINVCGLGAGQLLLGWSGTTGAIADVYYRSLRDSAIGTPSGWSPWSRLARADEVPNIVAAVVVNFTSGAITVNHYWGSGISVSRPRSASFRFFHKGTPCTFNNGYFVSLSGIGNTLSAYSSLMWGLTASDAWSAPIDGGTFYANMNDFTLSFLIFKK